MNDWNRLGRHVVSAESIGSFKRWLDGGEMDECWGEKELPRVGHQLASCSLLILVMGTR